MSTKIWTAYRSKAGVKLWPLIASLRVKAEKNILRILEEEVKRLRKENKEWTNWSALNHMRREFEKQHESAYRHYYGMDVSLVIRERKSRLYIIPISNGLMHKSLDFLHRDQRLEDFHYQNQSDKSAKVSDKAWETRGRIWDELDQDDTHWNDRLVLEIFHPGAFFRISYPLMD